MKRVALAVAFFGVLTASAQYGGRSGVRYINDGTVFTARRTSDWSQDRRDGKCTIRVRIDDDSDVELRGDQIRIRVLRGGPGRDEGSECNAPLPTSGNIRNFRFRGIDGRGNPRLVQEPGQRNYYVAVVNVQDPRSGDEGFTFDLMWQWDGGSGGPGSGGGGGFFPGDRPTTRPTPGTGGGGFFPGNGGLPDMNTSMAGDGNFFNGSNNVRLQDLNVRINGGQCRITLSSDRNDWVEMWGSTIPNAPECDLRNTSANGRLNGRARFQMQGNRITNVTVEGTLNGQRFNGSFTSR